MLTTEKLTAMTDMRDLWLFLQRNARLILLCTLGITLLAATLAFVLPPKYRSTAVLMVDPRKAHVTSVQDVLSSLPADNFVVRSELDIVQSSNVMGRVIDDLKLLQDPDFNPALKGAGWWERYLPSAKTLSAEEKAAQSRVLAMRTLAKHLNVSNDGRSYTISIEYRDHDAARAARIANAFAEQYLVDQLEVKYAATQRANDWITKRLDSMRADLNAAEKAVEEFKIKNNLVGAGDSTITQQQLAAVNAQLVQARTELAQAEARLNSVRGRGGQRVEVSSAVLSSDLIQKLKVQEAEVRRKEADLATRYGERHPSMINARNEMRSIHDKISEETQKIVQGFHNDVDVARAKVTSLNAELNKLQVATGAGNKATVTLHELQRVADANRGLYQDFLDRSKQLGEQRDLQLPDARIIANAEIPAKPYFPNLFVFIALGMVGGGMTGFCLALLLEYLDRGFRSLGLIEKLYDVSGIGITPALRVPRGKTIPDYILDKPLSIFAEAIRSIRTAIHFTNVDIPPKVIMVTSSIPNEGKTVFCACLARLLALSGQKALLIDTDLRLPKLQGFLKLDGKKPDLAAVLEGKATFAEAIHKDASGAHIIMARGKTANPQELLAADALEHLIDSQRGHYDMIILDTPPILPVSDAAVVARLADAAVYLVRWAESPREVVADGLKKLRSLHVKMAGVVLSQVDLEQQKQYGFGDYGYYSHEYKNYYVE